ncbi:hypothetical protein [Ramlibacter sp. WS9]|uniref:hypothetical protein n=1 Tax=Ramlibacter sp. WS9 TaxID=1882741 RepID=UPI0011450504|nr:hypothetical protein [Ramlibacter sp. WS9]
MSETTKLCRLCRTRSDFIKAHCIPEAFFRELRQGHRAPLMVADRSAGPVRRAPIGVYDSEILCTDCESSFAAVDTYGVQVLLQRFEELFAPMYNGSRLVAWSSQDVDCPTLLKFLVAVLWWASVSSHPFYARVQLGPHEEAARAMLLQPEGNSPPRFDAVFPRWGDAQDTVDLTTSINQAGRAMLPSSEPQPASGVAPARASWATRYQDGHPDRTADRSRRPES